jgi:hypothetical protein
MLYLKSKIGNKLSTQEKTLYKKVNLPRILSCILELIELIFNSLEVAQN